MFRSQWRRASARCLCGESLETRAALRASNFQEVGTAWQEFPLEWGGVELNVAPQGTSTNSSDLNFAHDVLGFKGKGQTVAIIDSGVAYDHPALGGGLGTSHRVVGGWDFTEENDANPYDDGPAGFHGTHVAGIVGSSDVNHTGLAPEVDIVALRVFNDQGSGSFDWVERALRWVHQNRFAYASPITTVNMSLGTDWNSNSIPSWSRIEDELALLETDGIVVVASAGNSFRKFQSPGLTYPAASPHVIAAASVGPDGKLSSFSQRVNGILAAPGESIVSTAPDYLFDFNGITDDFTSASGTSMSAPYVSGASVLVRQAMQAAGWQTITPLLIENHLLQTADSRIDSVTSVGYKTINLRRALETLVPASNPGSGSGSGSTNNPPVSDPPPSTIPVQSLGVATQHEWTLATVTGGSRYAFSASHTGWLTLEWRNGTSAHVTLRNPQGGVIQQLAPSTQTQRWDVPVQAGQALELWFSGANGQENVRVTNLVAQSGGNFTIYGTGSVDTFSVQGTTNVFAINDTQYALAGLSNVNMQLSQWQPTDLVQIRGGTGDDSVQFSPSSVSWNGIGGRMALSGYKSARLHGGGGRNTVQLNGTAADEAATLEGNSGRLRGSDYELVVEDFSIINVQGQGGVDRVTWNDTAATDLFFSQASESRMQGTGYQNTAQGFAQHTVQATRGGADWAYLTGSAADDRFTATSDRAVFSSGSRNVEVTGFQRVYCEAIAGGVDSAFVTESLVRGSTPTGISGPNSNQNSGMQNIVSGFPSMAGVGEGWSEDLSPSRSGVGITRGASASSMGSYCEPLDSATLHSVASAVRVSASDVSRTNPQDEAHRRLLTENHANAVIANAVMVDLAAGRKMNRARTPMRPRPTA